MHAPEPPLPVAALLRRARNAKSAKERHDAALCGWECSVRLGVAAAPPEAGEARARLALASLGDWVQALEADAQRSLADPALLSAARLLREEGKGGRGAPSAVTARGLLEPLAAYRNRVHGHGAVREAAFYDGAARALADGLAAAWRAGVFWPEEMRLLFVDAIEVDAGGERRARLLDLAGAAPLVVDPDGTPAPDHLLPRRLYLNPEQRGTWIPLHPWALFDDGGLRERVLLFHALRRGVAEALDFAGGEAVRGEALEAVRPGVGEEVAGVFSLATSTSTSTSEGDEGADPSRFGPYTLLGKLGEGGMGIVHLARQEGLGRLVALKMLPAHAARDDVARRRFEREVAALARCDHPHVVKILASGEAKGVPYYAMERIEGADLAAHVARLRAAMPDERARARRLAALFRDAARGLAHLHDAGVVHRDVKPANLMVTSEGERIVVMDLGLAALSNASAALTREGAGLLGTLRYMAPEQLSRGLVEVDRRADVHALGATFFEALCRRPLHDGETEARIVEQILHEEPPAPGRANPRLPRDLALILRTAVERDRRRRYASAAALADDLDAFLEGRPIAARPPSLAYVLTLWARRSPVASAVAAALLVAGVVAVLLHARRLEEERRAEEALRVAAVANRARAQAGETRAAEARKQAEELLGFMLGDLQERLFPLGKLTLLESVAEKALTYYEGVAPERLAPPDRLRLAQALAWIAEILSQRGRQRDAAAAAERAIALCEGVAGTAADPRLAAEVEFDALGNLEYTLLVANDLPGARRILSRAEPIIDRLQAISPDDRWQVMRSATHALRWADLQLREGEKDAALRTIEHALAALPGDPDAPAQRRLVDGLRLRLLRRKTEALRGLGRSEEALAACREAAALFEGRLERDPSVDYTDFSPWWVYDLLGKLLCDHLRFAEAAAAQQRCVELAETVCALVPENRQFRRELGRALSERAEGLAVAGDVAGALAHLERARRVFDEAAAESDAEDTDAERARNLGRMANVLYKLGRRDEALTAIEEGRRLAAKPQRTSAARAQLVAFRITAAGLTARAHRAAGRLAEAVADAEEAHAAALENAGASPERPLHWRTVIQTCGLLSGYLESADRWADAARVNGDAIDASRRLADVEPAQRAAALRTGAGALNSRAFERQSAKDLDGALEDAGASVAAWREVEALPGQASAGRVGRAEAARTRASILQEMGRLDDALAAFRDAADVLEEDLAAAPGEGARLERTYTAVRGLMNALDKAGRASERDAALARLRALLARLVAASPGTWSAHRYSAVAALDAAGFAERGGDAAEAARLYAESAEASRRCEAVRPPAVWEAEQRRKAEEGLARAQAALAKAGPEAPSGTARPRP